MPQSKTKLYHTCATEGPVQCITGDLSGEGFLVIVDKRTHELVVQEGATAETVTVAVSPRGAPEDAEEVTAGADVTGDGVTVEVMSWPAQVQGVSPRPGTRMLDLPPSSADPMQQAEQSIEGLRRKQHKVLPEGEE